MECKRLPVDYKIRNFTLKIIVLIKNSGFIVSLQHQKTCQNGQVTICKKQTILINMIHYLIKVLIFHNSFHNPISIN